MKRVVIVGGGISGLALAFHLQQIAPSVEITLLERLSRPGGTMWTERREGFQIEIGPNGFLDNKPATLDLCRDVGLAGQLLPASANAGRNRYLFPGDKLRRLPSSLGSFITSDLLSMRGKIDLLLERFRSRRLDKSDESIDAFVRRRAGREAAEVLADALVTGIHAGDPTLLSVRSAFPRLVELEEKFGSVIKGMAATAKQRRRDAKAKGLPPPKPSQMWSFAEGLRLLAETLSARLNRPPMVGVAVRRIEKTVDGWLVLGEGQDQWPANVVVLTCPAHEQAALINDFDADLAQRIDGIAYNRVAVIALGFRLSDVPMPLDGFGYLAPQRLRRDVLGVQWCSSIFPGRAPEGTVLMRAMCGGWNRSEMVDWDDGRLLEAVRAELRLALGVTAAPVFVHLVRWQRAIPQYHLGHGERVEWIEGRVKLHPGLILGGNAYHGVALNDCTEQGQLHAQRIMAFLNPARSTKQ